MAKTDLENSNGSAKDGNTRWWESYLVRYFIGFIFGSVCIAILGVVHGESLLSLIPDGLEIKTSGVLIALSLMGVGYCYIASSPITVMHHGRFSRNWVDGQSRYFWLGLLATLVVYGWETNGRVAYVSPEFKLILGIILVIVLPVKRYAEPDGNVNSKNAGDNHDASAEQPPEKKETTVLKAFEACKCRIKSFCSYRNFVGMQNVISYYRFPVMVAHGCAWFLIIWSFQGIFRPIVDSDADNLVTFFWLLSAPVFWVGLAQYCVIIKIILQEKELYAFYANLFEARRHKDARDIRDTYTHLREHSNSVFIVVLEIAILALVCAIAKTGGSDFDGWQILGLVIGGMFFWLLPTVFLWSRANAMELRFSERKGDFLPSDKNT